jgi:hypothetical protein
MKTTDIGGGEATTAFVEHTQESEAPTLECVGPHIGAWWRCCDEEGGDTWWRGWRRQGRGVSLAWKT